MKFLIKISRKLSRCVDRPMEHSYEAALSALNSLQSNAATLEKIKARRALDPAENLRWTESCMKRIGLQVDDLDPLNVIHVAGTKGKGSVCALTESVLRAFGFKTGFFSSPHLVHVRERIRINGCPISESKFCHNFWSIYNNLLETKAAEDGYMPSYFKFLALMAFKIFLEEKVDVAIIEVGIGGAFDCTNIVRKPTVCAITTLDIDHTEVLGNTIEAIAWQKCGIFKQKSVGICADQDYAAIKVVMERSDELKCPVYFAPAFSEYGEQCHIGIDGIPQHQNASIALQISHLWMKRIIDPNAQPAFTEKQMNGPYDDCNLSAKIASPFKLCENHVQGLETCAWPGRCQKLVREDVAYFLDGAHTPKSMKSCAQWFLESKNNGAFNILLFNCTSGRDSSVLLKDLMTCDFDAAAFCPNVVSTHVDLLNVAAKEDFALKKCTEFRDVFLNLLQNRENHTQALNSAGKWGVALGDTQLFSILPSINSALQWVENFSKKLSSTDNVENHSPCINVLVTGSLHLIGGVLSVLDPDLTCR